MSLEETMYMNQIRIMELRGSDNSGGGPEKTILLSAARHDKRRFFVLVTYLRRPLDDEFQIGNMAKKTGVPYYVEVLDRRKIDIKCLLELLSLVKRYDIQIIHVHDLKTTMLGLMLKVLKPKVKLMNTAHGWIEAGRADELKHKLQNVMLRFYPLHIAVSKATKDLMIRKGVHPSTIKVLYNSIDHEYWKNDRITSEIREEFSIPNESFVIGTVGRISLEKDLFTFFQVAKKIIHIYPGTRFMVVGDGRPKTVERLKKQVKELKIESSVVFTGHRTDLCNIYAIFDLFLTTSLTEGLPNTTLEAMSMEVPVVATNVGGIPEMITNNKTGLLCNVKDVKAISEKVISLLADPQKRMELAKGGRAQVLKKFSFQKRLETIEGFYCGLINGVRPKSGYPKFISC